MKPKMTPAEALNFFRQLRGEVDEYDNNHGYIDCHMSIATFDAAIATIAQTIREREIWRQRFLDLQDEAVPYAH